MHVIQKVALLLENLTAPPCGRGKKKWDSNQLPGRSRFTGTCELIDCYRVFFVVFLQGANAVLGTRLKAGSYV